MFGWFSRLQSFSCPPDAQAAFLGGSWSLLIFFVLPQVPPSLLKYPGGNGGLNTLLDPRQVAVLKQLSQFSQLSQLNQLNQLQVKVVADARLRRFLLGFRQSPVLKILHKH